MGTPTTPLSDAISQLLGGSNVTTFSAFVRTFRCSTVGVIATGLAPGRKPGETFQIGNEDDVRLLVVRANGGVVSENMGGTMPANHVDNVETPLPANASQKPWWKFW